MNKVSKEKKQQIIAVLVGSVVLVGCLWYFVILGQQQTIEDIRKKIITTGDQINAADNLIKKAPKAQSDLDESTKKVEAIEDEMASGDLYVWVINTVTKFRAGHKIEIRNYSRDEAVKVGVLPDFPYQGVKYIVTGTAYYHDLGKFIADFENTFQYFHIRNLEMGPSETTGDDQDKLNFKLEIVALVKPMKP